MDSNVIFGSNATWQTVTEKANGVNFCVGVLCQLDVAFTAARKNPYWFRVYAKNQLGAGPYSASNEQSVHLPTAPTGLIAKVIAPRTIFLHWIQPADTGVGDSSRALGNYTLQQSYGDNSFFDDAVLVNRSFSNTTFNATVLLPSSGPTYFFFRVYTFNDAGRSLISSSVQEQGVELPSEPINSRTQITTPLEITFFWSMPEDTGVTGQIRPLTGYILQVAEENGHASASTFTSLWYSDNDASPVGQAKNLSKLFGSLIKGKTYIFRVAAKNEAGAGAFSAAVSNDAITKPDPPAAFEAAVRNPFQIDMQWIKPPDTGFLEADMSKILRFELEQSTDESFSTAVSANLIATAPLVFFFNFSASTVTKGQRHYFRIWAVNEAGRSLYPSNVSEQAIDVPSTPTQLSISITAVLELTVEWRSVEIKALFCSRVDEIIVFDVVLRSASSSIWHALPPFIPCCTRKMCCSFTLSHNCTDEDKVRLLCSFASILLFSPVIAGLLDSIRMQNSCRHGPGYVNNADQAATFIHTSSLHRRDASNRIYMFMAELMRLEW